MQGYSWVIGLRTEKREEYDSAACRRLARSCREIHENCHIQNSAAAAGTAVVPLQLP